MKFRFCRSSDMKLSRDSGYKPLEFNTLGELCEYVSKEGRVILQKIDNTDRWEKQTEEEIKLGIEFEIEDYNDYRE